MTGNNDHVPHFFPNAFKTKIDILVAIVNHLLYNFIEER